MKRVSILRLPSGEEPFEDWLSLLDCHVQALIDSYIDRVSMGGSVRNVKHLVDGIYEIKINTGPKGQRISKKRHQNGKKVLE